VRRWHIWVARRGQNRSVRASNPVKKICWEYCRHRRSDLHSRENLNPSKRGKEGAGRLSAGGARISYNPSWLSHRREAAVPCSNSQPTERKDRSTWLN
jgi:hypothetical protein